MVIPETQSVPIVMFVILFLICVTADGDDADGRAGRVGDDDGLPGDMVLVLLVAGGAASLFDLACPPAAPTAALWWWAIGGRAIL